MLSSCQSLTFYHQAITGQSELLLKRVSVESLVNAPDTDPELRLRLLFARQVVEFAEREGLPVTGAYESYVETGRRYVVWNVFAAPTLELQLVTSCFPVAGCVSYRGYFKEEAARNYAARLKQDGYDVYVGGVTAYSTLGWFDDPLLDTFLFQRDEYLAALLFHELAHRLLYIKDDTRFNESLATSVEQVLLQKWLSSQNKLAQYDEYLASEARRSRVLTLIEQTRQELVTMYGSGLSDAEKFTRKEKAMAGLVERFQKESSTWSNGQEFSVWMSTPINNAKLETVADYNAWVPVMSSYLREHGLKQFSREMTRLGRLGQEQRNEILESMPTTRGNTSS